jgi:hypothetical protein
MNTIIQEYGLKTYVFNQDTWRETLMAIIRKNRGYTGKLETREISPGVLIDQDVLQDMILNIQHYMYLLESHVQK